MTDRLTLTWAIIAAFIAALIGLAVSYAVETRWVAPCVMFATMVTLASFGRVRRKVRDLAKRD